MPELQLRNIYTASRPKDRWSGKNQENKILKEQKYSIKREIGILILKERSSGKNLEQFNIICNL